VNVRIRRFRAATAVRLERVRTRPGIPFAAVAGLLGLLLAACTSPTPPSSGAPTPSGPQDAEIAGWRLSLPEENDNGDARTVDPAVLSPPYLIREQGGELTFWAPVEGATTRNSDQARTEISSNENFPAGSAAHELRASVAVVQVPPERQDVIIGQIHGADDLISVAFVMLHYTGGAVHVVVKHEHEGDESTDLPLLTGVPLGAPFDFTMRDNGNGSLTFAANHGSQHATVDTALPPAFAGATVRFQFGAYQQDSSDSDPGPADGARVTFSTATTTSGPVVPLP
jgi:hypothetical protein